MVWIQSIFGAFSINCADTSPGSGETDPDTLMVRARRHEHLKLLQDAFPTIAGLPLIETPSGDYRWRIIAPKHILANVLAKLVTQVDYRNFKSACSARSPELGERYTGSLHDIWSILRCLQD